MISISTISGGEAEDIRILKPISFDTSVRVDLLTSQLHYLPGYVQPFGAMFVERYQEKIQQMRCSMKTA